MTRGRFVKQKGYYPPNPKQWDNETNGLKLREQLDLEVDVRLPAKGAFQLLPAPVEIVPHGEVEVAKKYVEMFRSLHSSSWSALALTFPEGDHRVIYNDSHTSTRTRVSILEEFFHLRLGHSPSSIRLYADGNGSRSHDAKVEDEAYCSAAAALLPFKPLKSLIVAGQGVKTIAEQFDVSRALVYFRAKVTKQYKLLK